MAGLNPARRYKMLSERNRAKEGDSADASSQIDFKQAMHDENETGVLSIMNSMFSMQRLEKSGRESEGFKLAVIQWSSAYGVAYSLMLTIAFSMLVTKPLPPGPIDPNAPFLSKDWRFPSERLDAIMPLLYYFFAAAACCDSAWGMLICAEWGVRGGVVPADMYEKFIRNLRPDPKDPDTKANTMWAWRCFEPRAVHDGLPTCGVFCPTNWKPDWHLGWAQTPSWDPFYFVDRTVMSLFCAAVCLVYMNNGALASGIILYFFLSLWGVCASRARFSSLPCSRRTRSSPRRTASGSRGPRWRSRGTASAPAELRPRRPRVGAQ